jgi:hypothetical protein
MPCNMECIHFQYFISSVARQKFSSGIYCTLLTIGMITSGQSTVKEYRKVLYPFQYWTCNDLAAAFTVM